MSKKKFTEGLDDLLQSQSGPTEAAAAGQTPMERKAVHKNFMSDLDALLQEALEESIGKYEANQPDSPTAAGKSKSAGEPALRRNMPVGLDALIRQTIDVQEINSDEEGGKKRLTVAVDRTKLEKLKLIARLENAYLKDLLVNLIDEYIEEYTQQKGIPL